MILICGISGLVGYELSNYLDTKIIQHIGTYKTNKINKLNVYPLDYSNPTEVESFLMKHQITCCVFCIVERLTDKCENAWNEIKNTNVDLVHNMSYLCNQLNIRFIHLSTDYVFDGFTQPNYPESPKNPLQNYGISKLISEFRVQTNSRNYCIVRIPVLYTNNSKIHNNAVSLIGKNVMDLRKNITYKEDNYNLRRPLYIRDMCPFLLDCINSKDNGIYHFFNPTNKYTKYEIARIIANNLEIDASNIIPNNNKNEGIAPRPYDTQLTDNQYDIHKYSFSDFNETIMECFGKYRYPKIDISNRDKIFIMLDLDNTLINSDNAHYNAYKHAFTHNNMEFMSIAEWKNIINTSNIDTYLLSKLKTSKFVDNIKKEKLDFLLKEDITYTRNSEIFLRFLINNEFNFCVVTNTSRNTTKIFKNKLPLLNEIKQWVVREDYNLAKPHSECYQLAIDKYRKEEEYVIGVEDSLVGYNSLKFITGLNQRIIESVPADSHSSGSMTDKEMNPAPKGKIHLFIGLIFVFNNVDVFNKNDCYLFDDYNQLLNIN